MKRKSISMVMDGHRVIVSRDKTEEVRINLPGDFMDVTDKVGNRHLCARKINGKGRNLILTVSRLRLSCN